MIKNTLINHIEKLHTTKMGVNRIKRNLTLETEDVVAYCKRKILDNDCRIYKQGKTGLDSFYLIANTKNQ